MEVDLVIRNATVATASDILPNQDIVVKDERILCLGQGLSALFKARREIDAEGAFVTPGGIDSHVHLHQDNSPTGDTFATGTRSAIAGGTTTILAFASQERTDESLFPVVEEYHRRSAGQSYCDYGFHLILTNPTPKILQQELPVLVKDEGISSVKLYMTYQPLKLVDRQILDVMTSTRALGMTTMVHAENSDMIDWITERLEERRMTDPYYHAVSRPNIAEDEATYRVISLSELMDIPILIVHMSSKIAAAHVRKAQTRLLPIHAETCPHYLFFKSDRLRGEHFEGAKCVCSPPLREDQMDLDAMWQGLKNGTFTTFSSDHAPSKFDHPQGKKAGLVNGTTSFRKIPNGLPGLETRVPVLFSGGVLKDKISIQKFVELTSSNPAKLYGLDKKGTIAPGFDADLVIWYPSSRKMTPFALTNDMLHHDIDYTPFEGMEFENWPRWTILRGSIVWDRENGGIVGQMGYGRYLKRGRSTLSKPREVFVNEFRPY
ncbi:D-hydantoinase [Gloeophyllum trabeum ATCC 11539]|uniref:dihydropyrimidinase n=1 Tax=Gloeophyllum trabeum (strain ATCC 11539 / FP-39264 / Madison 617) TaxID=670483 RepID=S7PVS5_GLOTA|nr:D-hydantoinase [Gloeophyllum trabeum ATCC 11539]EPQ51462.1 D-hydantoinase [Gloeophyllum trabeum ATCC 11539]